MQPRNFTDPGKVRQVMTFVLDQEVTTERLQEKTGTTAKKEDLKKVRQPWRATLNTAVQICVSPAVVKVRGNRDLLIDDAIKGMSGVDTSWLDLQAIKEILAAKPASEGFTDTAVGKNYQFLLGQFFEPLDLWKQSEIEFTQAKDAYGKLIANSVTLENHAMAKVAQQVADVTTCMLTFDGARSRGAGLLKHPTFGDCMKGVVEDLGLFLDGKVEILQACGAEAAWAGIDAWYKAANPAQLTTAQLDQLFIPLALVRLSVSTSVTGRLLKLSDDKLAELAEITTKATDRTALTLLLSTYGGPGFYAFTALETTNRLPFLDLYRRIADTFKSKVPPQSANVNLLSARFGRVIAAGNVKDAEIALESSFPKIDLPKGVTDVTWQLCCNVLVPRMFSVTGGVSTDNLCIKHVEDETGVKPSPAKLARYFADMIKACIQAGEIWVKDGGKDMSTVMVTVGQAEWKIVIGSENQKIVHHIDSGYRGSWWWEAA